MGTMASTKHGKNYGTSKVIVMIDAKKEANEDAK